MGSSAPSSALRFATAIGPGRRVPKRFNAYAADQLPAGVRRTPIDVIASDEALSIGILHEPPSPTEVCAVFMHPRTQQTRPYLAPYLLEAGWAVWGQHSRYVNNDTDMTHEEVLLDVAAGMRMLRDRGYRRIVLIGNSGGGSLLSGYQWQASLPPEERWTTDPAGEPIDLAGEDMPEAELFVALAAHQGEGLVLLDELDPAIVDETDPTRIDPALDLFSPANGYRPFPEPSSYAPEWVAAYRAAQRDRCRRIDALAHSLLAEQDAAHRADPSDLTTALARRAAWTPYLTIYGTCANPASLDPTISPNERPMGSIFANGNPFGGNSAPAGLGRVVTPRAWLSTWSGLSARCELWHAIAHVDLPTLFVYPNADEIVTAESQSSRAARAASDDVTVEVLPHALHYLGLAPGAPTTDNPRARAGEITRRWIAARL